MLYSQPSLFLSFKKTTKKWSSLNLVSPKKISLYMLSCSHLYRPPTLGFHLKCSFIIFGIMLTNHSLHIMLISFFLFMMVAHVSIPLWNLIGQIFFSFYSNSLQKFPNLFKSNSNWWGIILLWHNHHNYFQFPHLVVNLCLTLTQFDLCLPHKKESIEHILFYYIFCFYIIYFLFFYF